MKKYSTATWGFLGAIALALLCSFFMVLSSPAALRDGQTPMISMLACPLGWLAGCYIAVLKKDPMDQNADLGCGTMAIGAVAFIILGPVLMSIFLLPFSLFIR